MFKGIIASTGIAIGKVYKLEHKTFNVKRKTIKDVDLEKLRLVEAINEAKKELLKIKESTENNLGKGKAQIFDAHILVIEDVEFLEQVFNKIKQEKINAEYALKEIRNIYFDTFKNLDNEYIRERISDIKDVTDRVIAKLLNVSLHDPSLVNEEVILVAHDLSPSLTAQLNKLYVKGFVTNIGGRTSHSAIMARSLEIPAIVGTKNITKYVNDRDFIILDAFTGEVLINPSEEVINLYKEKQKANQLEQNELQSLKTEKSITIDNHHVLLGANIITPNDLDSVLKNGAEGIGLFRTEFLYMERSNLPSEEEQFNAYKTVLEKMGQKPVVIRTLDIGGDKEVPYLNMPVETNPFLGYRAIRLCLDRKEIFKTQLRALLRASIYGNLKIMFPMIATINEFVLAKNILLEVKEELITNGIKVSNNIEIGMMVEVPSAAILADQFAKIVDFFSIGTNDLIQYTFASDRLNEFVAYLYQPFNPSLLRLIKMVIDAAHKENKWVGMCGEMAGDNLAIPILLGLGLDEFSMTPTSILKARKIIRNLSYNSLKIISNQSLTLSTEEEVISLFKNSLK